MSLSTYLYYPNIHTDLVDSKDTTTYIHTDLVDSKDTTTETAAFAFKYQIFSNIQIIYKNKSYHHSYYLLVEREYTE